MVAAGRDRHVHDRARRDRVMRAKAFGNRRRRSTVPCGLFGARSQPAVASGTPACGTAACFAARSSNHAARRAARRGAALRTSRRRFAPTPGGCACGHSIDLSPSVARGDFDGDGRFDLAVLLRARSGWLGTIIVVFLDIERGSHPIVAGDGLETIATVRKGVRGHSYDDGRTFTYLADSIVTGCCECCAHALIYRRGRFFRVTVGD